jgi:hypothetical protein
MTQQSVADAYRRKLASAVEGDEWRETLEIYHPMMSKRYYLVRDNVPLTAMLETGTEVNFEIANIDIKSASQNADMNQSASFTIADVDNVLDAELDNIPLDSDVLPEFTYRRFLLSDLSYPALGPITYETQDINQAKGRFSATVSAPKLNSRGTGLILTPTNCSLLRGVLL